jgi:hypothetical protein
MVEYHRMTKSIVFVRFKAVSDQRIYNPLVADSNSTKPSSQLPENKEVTNLKENGTTPENPELVSGLFFELENDPELKQIITKWSELPEHIKAAIKALVQTNKIEKK